MFKTETKHLNWRMNKNTSVKFKQIHLYYKQIIVNKLYPINLQWFFWFKLNPENTVNINALYFSPDLLIHSSLFPY